MSGNNYAFSNSEMADIYLMYSLAECNSMNSIPSILKGQQLHPYHA